MKKNLNFDLNLVPFIDLLSTCICFLLLTAVWVQIGAMNVKQSVGGQPASETEKKPALWVTLEPSGTLALSARDSKKLEAKLTQIKIQEVGGKPDLEQLARWVEKIRGEEPQMLTALIQPQAQTSYEDIINVMDQFKKSGVTDLGVSPL